MNYGTLLLQHAESDPTTCAVIDRVVRRLPPEVQAFVVHNITVRTIIGGQAVPPGSLATRKWTVLLYALAVTDDAEGEALVAHEIAHCFLDGAAPDGATHEEMTAWTARQWGFAGSANGAAWAQVSAAEKLARRREALNKAEALPDLFEVTEQQRPGP